MLSLTPVPLKSYRLLAEGKLYGTLKVGLERQEPYSWLWTSAFSGGIGQHLMFLAIMVVVVAVCLLSLRFNQPNC